MSLIFDLIDRVIDLARRREEVDRAQYGDVVKALMDDVDALHRDYLTTFRKYRDLLVSGKPLDTAFLDAVAADSLFSRDLRIRVRAVAESDGDDRLHLLKAAVLAYLKLATVNPLDEWDERVMYESDLRYHPPLPVPMEAVPHDDIDRRMERTLEEWDMLFIMNASRLHLANGIMTVLQRGLEPELAARLAVRMIESIIIELQRRYAVITRAHSDVRKTLLDPK